MDHSIRDISGRFLPGTAPGPGRPANSRPRLITALRQALDEDQTLERLKAVAIRKLEEGDPFFWKMLLDRVWPSKMDVEVATEERRIVICWASELDQAHTRDSEVLEIQLSEQRATARND